jgi:hypothetical protein
LRSTPNTAALLFGDVNGQTIEVMPTDGGYYIACADASAVYVAGTEDDQFKWTAFGTPVS